MILITSAAFCPSEFGVEFGKIPPSFLPLGGRRLYEYQVELFAKFGKNQRIFLSLPQGFEVDEIEAKRLAKCGVKPIFVPQNLNLAQSINYCLNVLLPLDEPLVILHGDSYFRALSYAPNALGVSKALNSYDWVSLSDSKDLPFVLEKGSRELPFSLENGEKFTQNSSKNFTKNGENSPHELNSNENSVNFAINSRNFSQKFTQKLRKNSPTNSANSTKTESKNSAKNAEISAQNSSKIHALNSDELVLNGYFCIEKPYDFIRAMLRSNYDFILALKLYSMINPFKILQLNEWFDFGLLSSYFSSKSALTTQRAFNDLCLANGYFTKSSKDCAKINAEISWFKALPERLRLFTPRFEVCEKGYKTEYLHLNTLAEIFVFSRLPAFAYKQIFASIKAFLTELHSQKAPRKFDFDYRAKTLERLREFSRQRGLDLGAKIKFNAQILPSLLEICEFLDDFIAPNSEQCFIHGDFCFSNIFYDFRKQNLLCFDPRGRDFSGVATPFGEARYDTAKLAHSVLGLYDFIVFGFYECELRQNADKKGRSGEFELDFKLIISENVREIQALFLRDFAKGRECELLALCVHLFLSMLPLHYDDENKQNALIANALRLFCELKNEVENSKDGA